VLLVSSSFAYAISMPLLGADDDRGLLRAIGVTALLGIASLALKGLEWSGWPIL
jgi:heme/copper-type cytochrome/quinol oxidase subunit 3